MKNNNVQRLLVVSLLAAFAVPAQAQVSAVIDAAREKLSEIQTGRTAKSNPVAAKGAVDSWGDPMPWRGEEAVPLQAGRQKPGAAKLTQRDLTKEQQADERNLDDRFTDRRVRTDQVRVERVEEQPRVVAEPLRRVAAPAAAPVRRAAAPRAAAPRAAPEDRAYQRVTAEREAPSSAACTNVKRAWEGASAMADRGQDDKAYDAYLRLLSSCREESELLGTIFQAQKNLEKSSVARLLDEPVMQSPKLEGALNALKLQQMFAANKSKDARTALTISREIRPWVLDGKNAGAMEVSGWLEQRAKNPKAAEALFRSALRVDPDSDGARQGLVFSLLAQEKVDAANREVKQLTSSNADEVRAEVALAQARQSLQQKRYAQAITYLDEAETLGISLDSSELETRAWALKGLGKSKEAGQIFAELAQANPNDPKMAAAAVEAMMLNRQFAEVKELSRENSPIGIAAKAATADHLEATGQRREAANMRGTTAEGYAGNLNTGMTVRTKSGEQGEGRLLATTIPQVSVSMPVGDSSELNVDVSRLSVKDGRNSADGMEVRVGGKTRVGDVDLDVMAGVSRVGDSTKPVIDARASVDTAIGKLGARVSHLPVVESVRSYAGVNVDIPGTNPGDPSKRVFVGRAMDTQASVSGSMPVGDDSGYSVDWEAGGGAVSGTNTESNGYYKGSVALMKDFSHPSFSWLNAGPYLNVSSYERDENQFGGTEGGYFSPKSDVGFGLMGNLQTTEGGRSMHKASAKMGYVTRSLNYGTDSGISLEGSSQSAWLVGSHLIVGAGVGFRASPGYTDLSVRVGLTIPFEPRAKLYSSDLPLFKSQ